MKLKEKAQERLFPPFPLFILFSKRNNSTMGSSSFLPFGAMAASEVG